MMYRRSDPFASRFLWSLLGALLLALSSPLGGQTLAQWNRYPAISPDGTTIVFTYRGDLYRVPVTGGTAVPLTTHLAHDFMPVWSRDGRHIVFASNRHGNFDLFLIPASGGEARRLTYHSADEFPYAFEPGDTTILFGAVRQDSPTYRGYPTGSQPELYRVGVNGGRVRQVLTTPAEAVQVVGNGEYLLYHDKKGGENEWRKHHTSSIARDIWIYDTSRGTHRKLTTFAGEDRNPVVAPDGRSFFYLSEETGTFNVHRMSLEGGPSTPVTRFTGPPVRFLSVARDGTLCFSWDGEIYLQRGDSPPQRVPVTVATDAKANSQQVISITGGASEMAVSPNGKEVAFVARGEVFVVAVEGGMTKQITRTPATEVGLAFSPDGNTLAYASQRDGRWGIFQARRARPDEPYFYAATLIEETPLIHDEHENSQPVFSPDGKALAYIQNRNTLRVMDLETRQSRTLLTTEHLFSNRIGGHTFRWSPDGEWILFDYSIPGLAPGEVGLVRADGTGTVVNLTRSGFEDRSGQWVLDGQAMIWYSNRDGLKSVAQSGRSEMDVYAMFFTQDAWDRFRLSEAEYQLLKEMEEKNRARADTARKDTARAAAPHQKTVLELEGVELRKARLTTHSSSMAGALLSKDGETLYYLARFERGYDLWSLKVRSRETRKLVELNASSASMMWDKDQKAIFLLAGGSLSKVDPSNGRRENITIRGEMVQDAEAQRAYFFEHVWKQTKQTFYTAGFHGADWDGLKTAYAKYLPHIGNGFEFAEMLSEMLGELNVSHSGARFSSSDPGDDATASLGIFYDQAYDGPGIRILEVMKNGPLDKAGMDIRPGMIIESIDGEPIAADRDPAFYLNRKAGKRTLLVVRDGNNRKEIVTTPISLSEENRLLYDRWVRRNREEVERLSNGQLGYIHVPGMNDGAYRSVFEEVLGRFADRKGLVVDTRFNGGGDLVADLAMFLSGQKFFDYTTDTRSAGYEPNFRWTKPSVSLANEANYSDGHCYAYAYQALGIGPLVGMPVPGTCTFAGWETLPDGTRWGVPGLGVKNTAGRYLENLQTEPDIRVMNEPEVASQGRDQQLEAAVAELLRRVGG